MKPNITSFIILVALSGYGTAAALADPSTPSQQAQGAENPLPAAAAIIRHRVKNYDAWKIAFDSHQVARQNAGIVGHHLNRGAQDPNLVVIYLPAVDAARLQEFLGSADLETTMQKAGVEGPPTITLVTPREDSSIRDRALPAVIISHRVANYTTWKKAFDGHETKRTEAGIIGRAVNQQADDGNQVVIYLQAENAGQLKAFVNSEDLKAVMKDAGVQGPPQFSFVNGLKGASY